MLQDAGYQVRPFADGEDFLEAVDYLKPGCALVDIFMPGVDGIEVLKRLAARDDLALLMMTSAGDIPLAVRAMKSGAIDFIEKPFADRDLLDTLEHAFSAILPQMGQQAARREKVTKLIEALSAREREVAAGLLGGMGNKMMALTLNLSVRTIETHRATMMRKLGVQSVGEVVQLALEAGLEPLKQPSSQYN